jgi:uncharacterized YccA/Bax inhibitor family protein
VKSSNPVLGRLVDRSNQHASFQRAPVQQPYGTPGYGTTPEYGYDVPGGIAPARTGRMTIDDVVVRTLGLLAIVGIAGAAAWVLVPANAFGTTVLFGAVGVGLVLGLVISFMGITNPLLISAYAVVQGVLVGVISRVYEDLYSGIVLQAVVVTFGIFFGMAALYKFRVIRATPTFVKWVTGAVIGVFLLMIVNFLLAIFDVNNGAGLGLRAGATGDVGWLPVVFSLVCIGVASLTFILDFKAVEDGVNAGVDEKYAWYASFGILVGLIWLYLEILRFLSYLRR